MFDDKVLLISGGTGSFGNAVLRRFIETDIKEIRILKNGSIKSKSIKSFIDNTIEMDVLNAQTNNL